MLPESLQAQITGTHVRRNLSRAGCDGIRYLVADIIGVVVAVGVVVVVVVDVVGWLVVERSE